MRILVAATAALAVPAIVGASSATAPRAAGCHLKWRAAKGLKGRPLADVFAVSASNVWAVGATRSGKVLVAHWNGRRWRSSAGATDGYLSAVDGTSARNIWAVGYSARPLRPLVVRYDGRGWKDVSSALPPAATVRGGDVVALAPDDVWISGGSLVHWDGRSWSVVANGFFPALAAVSPSDVWAVGTSDWDAIPPETRIAHWNGLSWNPVRSGLLDDLYGATAISARNVWAVGATSGTAVHQAVAHWNGSRWTAKRLPTPDWLNDVSASGPRDVWAVGNWAIAHWNGRRWRTEVVRDTELTGVAAISRRNVWAVGGGSHGGLILHFACR